MLFSCTHMIEVSFSLEGKFNGEQSNRGSDIMYNTTTLVSGYLML